MKHFGKKIAALALASCMLLPVALTGCNKTDPCTNHVDADSNGKCDVCGVDMPAAKITDGRWENKKGENFLKLNTDNTFYLVGMFVNDAGTYEIKNEQVKYYKIEAGATPDSSPDAEDYPGTTVDTTEYTASQKLVLTAYSGTVYTAAYADGIFWNCQMPNPAGIMSRTLRQKADYEWNAEEDETAIELIKVCNPKDEIANLVLYHNKTFADQTNGYTEGTWEKTSTGYTLKKEDGSAHATVTTVADGKCTYTPANGTAVTLYEKAWTPVNTLNGKASVTLKGQSSAQEANFDLKLWGDDSVNLIMTDKNYSVTTILSGTWESKDNGTIELTFGTDKVTISAPDTANENAISVTLTLEDMNVFASAAEVTLTGTGVASAATEYGKFVTAEEITASGIPGVDTTETHVTATMYSDNTVKLTVNIFGTEVEVDKGTYAIDTSGMLPAISFTFETAGQINASPDYATASATGITFNLAYTADEVAVSALGQNFTISFTATMKYAYAIAPAAPTEYGKFVTAEQVTASGIPGVGNANTHVTATMYSDNTITLTVSIFGNEIVVDTGTYTIDTSGQLPQISFIFEKAGAINASPDYATASATGITFNLAYTAEEVAVNGLGNDFNISFTATMSYAYKK